MNEPKIGIIESVKFNASNYESFLVTEFKDISRGGISYKMLFAFAEWIDGSIFDFRFSTALEYTNWFNDFIYIIIPTELVPNLMTMTTLVEDVVFEDQFDVILAKETIETRNGAIGDIVTLSVKMVTCKVSRWEQGDDEKLASIVELFNSFYNPPRQIIFGCKFNSLQDLESFKQLNCYI